jgi:hypothetical protein
MLHCDPALRSPAQRFALERPAFEAGVDERQQRESNKVSGADGPTARNGRGPPPACLQSKSALHWESAKNIEVGGESDGACFYITARNSAAPTRRVTAFCAG